MKVAYIDGASLAGMMRSFGVRRINYPAFHKVLEEKVGTQGALAYPPPITMPPTTQGQPIEKVLRKSGFEPIFRTSDQSLDDAYIIDRLQAINPKYTSELILVSADQDFVPPLVRLAKRGVRIVTLATKVVRRPYMQNQISSTYSEHFAGLPFSFVDLAAFVDDIALTKVEFDARTTYRATIEGDIRTPAELARFSLALEEVAREFGVRITRTL